MTLNGHKIYTIIYKFTIVVGISVVNLNSWARIQNSSGNSSLNIFQFYFAPPLRRKALYTREDLNPDAPL